MTLLEFALAKRALRRWLNPRRRHEWRIGVQSNVRLRRVDRVTGEERIEVAKNDITNVPLLVDLIQGVSSDHLGSTADLRIQDSGGGLIKTIGDQRSGYPQAATQDSTRAWVVLGWEDLTTDAYNPDDLFLRAPSGTQIAQALNVAFSNKLATENWFFDWTIFLDGDADESPFDNDGLEHMLDVITGASSQHWDGTELAANMRIDVYDGTPGSLEFQQAINNAATQPSSTQLRFIFTRAAGGTFTWARVELWNAAAPVLLYDDDIANQFQNPNDAFEYEITISFS